MSDPIWNGEVGAPPAASPYVPCPEPAEPAFIPIAYPALGEKLVAIALGDRVQGCYMHWGEGRSVLCMALWGPCGHCKAGHSPRWQGYLAVSLWGSKRRAVLQIPERAYLHSRSLRELDGRLRGWVVMASRRGRSKNAPVVIEVKRSEKELLLQEAHNVGEALCRLWGFGVNSPVGRALVNPPSARGASDPSSPAE